MHDIFEEIVETARFSGSTHALALPESQISLHQEKNPFRKLSSKLFTENERTNQCSVDSLNISASTDLLDSKEKIYLPKTKDVGTTEATTLKGDCAVKKAKSNTNKIPEEEQNIMREVQIYQSTITPELEKNFQFIFLHWNEIANTSATTPIHLSKAGICKGLKTLILDLDETLIHSAIHIPSPAGAELRAHTIKFQKGTRSHTLFSIERPFLQTFLKNVSKSYEILVYTSSDERYSTEIVNKIDSGF